MTITGAGLIRTTGLAALMAGVIFAAIQPIHPADELTSVTTGFWTASMVLKLIMCFLFLFAIAGLYARQIKETGWLGLVGALQRSSCCL
jgi:hypothetical protein